MLACALVLVAIGCAFAAVGSMHSFRWWALPFAIPVLLYVTPIVPALRNVQKLKVTSRYKTILVALSWWAGVRAVASSWDDKFGLAALISFSSLSLLIKIFVETLMRDIIDADEDIRSGVRSMGQAGGASLLLAGFGSCVVIGLVALSFPLGHVIVMSLFTTGMMTVAVAANRILPSESAKSCLDLLTLPWYVIY